MDRAHRGIAAHGSAFTACLRLRTILVVLSVLVPAPASADAPQIRAVKQKRHHCGVACAETILRAYGDQRPWTTQTALAAALCARLPEFKWRRPAASDAIESYYPDFEETYQPELAELLIDHGYFVISTRSSRDGKTQAVQPHIWALLRDHLAQGHLAILHVPGHYVAATGIDPMRERLYFVDPWRADEVFSTEFRTIAGGTSFHTTRGGKPRPGWDGRMLIFWKGDTVNQPDRCPACGAASANQSYAYCKKCRCYVDRRRHNRVQRALDAITACRVDETLTHLSPSQLRATLRRLEAGGEFSPADVRLALTHYPLHGSERKRLMTLHRHVEANDLDITALTVPDLIEIVTARETWRDGLRVRLTGRASTPNAAPAAPP